MTFVLQEWELSGALSNPLATDKRLDLAAMVALKTRATVRKPAVQTTTRANDRRRGIVLETVTDVLGRVGKPMSVSNVHAAVEAVLADTVPYSSVKEALSAHSRGSDKRFRRIRRGWYERRPKS
jgi:hypothetical protein